EVGDVAPAAGAATRGTVGVRLGRGAAARASRARPRRLVADEPGNALGGLEGAKLDRQVDALAPGGALAGVPQRLVEAGVPAPAVAEAVVEKPGGRLRQHAVCLRQVAEAAVGVRRVRDVGMCVPGCCVARLPDRLRLG